MKDLELNDMVKMAFADIRPSAELEAKAKRLALRSRLNKLRLILSGQIAAAAAFLFMFTQLRIQSPTQPENGVSYIMVGSIFGAGTGYIIAAAVFVTLCAVFITLYYRNKNKLK